MGDLQYFETILTILEKNLCISDEEKRFHFGCLVRSSLNLNPNLVAQKISFKILAILANI